MIKILIVDDKQENLYLLQSILEFNNFITIPAKNGSEALEILKNESMDLIISDILMPVMDGFTLLRECKNDNHLKPIPFIFYTATYTDLRDEQYALSLGVDRFIRKPQEPDDLLKIINDFLDEIKKTPYKEKELEHLPENVVLKEYNEVLIRKIEDKMLQTEKNEKELKKYAEDLEKEIKERIKNEESLRKSEEYNRLLFNTTPIGLALCSLDGSMIDVNPAFAKIIGRTVEESLKLTHWDITPQKYATQEHERIKRLKETGHYGIIEKEYIHKDGHLVPVIMQGLIIERDGKQFIWSSVEDVSERKKTELALEKSRQLFQTLAQVSPVGIFRTTPEGYTTYVNPKWTELSGLTFEEATGNKWLDAVHPDDRDKILRNWNSDTKSQNTSIAEYRFLRNDGSIVWVIGNAVPEWSNNRINGYIGTITDITRIKLFEKELMQAKEKAEESDRLKSAFLSNISHEIRTPMNGILGFADLLQDPDITGEEQKKYLAVIQKSGERMLNIINEIVDISKIVSGQMELSLSETNVNNQIEFIYAFFKPQVLQKGIRFSYQNPLTDQQALIITDSEKLNAILSNLVNNAIKYTEEGSIEFGYDIVEIKGLFTLQFYVRDTGSGIPKNRQEAIFESFVQADIEDKKAKQGAGLGLSISKAYIEMLGGKIWLESDEGKGTTFYFTIPIQNSREINYATRNEKVIHNIDAAHLRHLKILISEDDEASALLIQTLLNNLHSEIISVENGVDAVNVCQNNPDIDLVLMDIKMPGLNGLEATRQIREFNKNVIIIAQTAFALSGDQEEALEAGCNDYIVKPIKVNELKKLLAKHFSI